MKNQPGSPALLIIFFLVIVGIAFPLVGRVNWGLPHAPSLAIFLVIVAVAYIAFGIAVKVDNHRETHDPASNVSADIMEYKYLYPEIPSYIWDQAVGTVRIAQNENKHYWKDGWSFSAVYLAYKHERRYGK